VYLPYDFEIIVEKEHHCLLEKFGQGLGESLSRHSASHSVPEFKF